MKLADRVHVRGIASASGLGLLEISIDGQAQPPLILRPLEWLVMDRLIKAAIAAAETHWSAGYVPVASIFPRDLDRAHRTIYKLRKRLDATSATSVLGVAGFGRELGLTAAGRVRLRELHCTGREVR